MYASVLIGLGIAIAAPAPKEAPKKDPGIVGEWVAIKIVTGGIVLPTPSNFRYDFISDGILVVRDGNEAKPETASFTIEPKKDPAEIDLIPPAAKKEPTMLGIYKIDGDTLTLCFKSGGPAPERPKSFASVPGSSSIMVTFKRVKKD